MVNSHRLKLILLGCGFVWIAAAGFKSLVADLRPDKFSDYVVSWTGKYLFTTIDTHGNPPLHRVFVIDADHPEQPTAIGNDFEGKGFAGVYCSQNEAWLCINLGIGVHGAECHLFKHISERRFDQVDTPDINSEAKSLFEATASPGFTLDAVYGLYWQDDSLVLLASGRGQKNGTGDLYTDELFLEYQTSTGQVRALSQHFLSPMKGSRSEDQDPEYVRLQQMSLTTNEQSLQHQLNEIYNLVLQKLDTAGRTQMVSEQKQWELARDKKPAGRYERDFFVQQRINALAARFLTLR